MNWLPVSPFLYKNVVQYPVGVDIIRPHVVACVVYSLLS